jgi:uncharacterized protein (DUF934 family)
MPLIRHGRVVEDDFVLLQDDQPLSDEGSFIVPADRLLADASDILRRNGATGVVWPNNRDVAALETHLHRLALIGLVFPNFRDGRAYSQARLLRERHGYKGELRATGQVLRDQFLFMLRAGFDSFDVAKPGDAAAFLGTLQRYSAFYQPAADQQSAKRGRFHAAAARSRVKTTV